MGYKIGNHGAIIDDNQNGYFGQIKVHSGNQFVINEDYNPFNRLPPSQGTVAGYYAGGADLGKIYYGGGAIPQWPGPTPFNGRFIGPNLMDTTNMPDVDNVFNTATYDAIQRFPFSAPVGATASDVGELIRGIGIGGQASWYGAQGASSQEAGYTLGGGSKFAMLAIPAVGISTTHYGRSFNSDPSGGGAPVFGWATNGKSFDKFSFSSQTNSTSPEILESDGRMLGGSVSFGPTYGKAYLAGGLRLTPDANAAINTVESWSFSSDTGSAETGTLSDVGAYGIQSAGSKDHGYFINGHNSTHRQDNPSFPPSVAPSPFTRLPAKGGTRRIDRWNAASETMTGNMETHHNPRMSFGAGLSSLDYGFTTGGIGHPLMTDVDNPIPAPLQPVQGVDGHPNVDAGQMLYDRQPGSTAYHMNTPTGLYHSPTDPSFPHFIPSNPGNPSGQQFMNYLYGYGMTTLFAGPAATYDPQKNSWRTLVETSPNPSEYQGTFSFNSYQGGFITPNINGFYGPTGPYVDPASNEPRIKILRYSSNKDFPGEPSDYYETELLTHTSFYIDRFPFALSEVEVGAIVEFSDGVKHAETDRYATDLGAWRNKTGGTFGQQMTTRIGVKGTTSTTHGYLAGGTMRTLYPSPTINFTPPGNPIQPLSLPATYGSAQNLYSNITSFPFAITDANTDDVGELQYANYDFTTFQD